MTVSMLTTRLSEVITGCGGKRHHLLAQVDVGARPVDERHQQVQPGVERALVAAEPLDDDRAGCGTIRTARTSAMMTKSTHQPSTMRARSAPFVSSMRSSRGSRTASVPAWAYRRRSELSAGHRRDDRGGTVDPRDLDLGARRDRLGGVRAGAPTRPRRRA